MSNSNQKKYPHNRDHFHNKSTNTTDEITQAVNECLQEVTVASAMGTWFLIKATFSNYAPITLGLIGTIIGAGYYISTEALHFRFLHYLSPEFFNQERIMSFYVIHRDYYWIAVSLLLFFPVVLLLGFYVRGGSDKI